MTCDSSSLSAGTRWVWIIPQREARRPWSDPVHRWSAAVRTEPPHVLRLALSPSCWVSSACLPRPSPKKAFIKSPLKTTTGLDSHKPEQNNLFFFFPQAPPPSPCLPRPHISMPVPICPTSSVAEAASTAARQRALLVYGCTLYWCELIPSGNTFGCHTPRFFLLPAFQFSCLHALMSLPWQDKLDCRQSCSHSRCCLCTLWKRLRV